MARRSFVEPPRWTTEELAEARARSIALFIDERQQADQQEWAATVAEIRELVHGVFDATNNLTRITAEVLLAEPATRWHVLRYCCAPPVSEEDLWTYVGGPKFKRVPATWAQSTAEVFEAFLDEVRFPWVADEREPTASELEVGLAMTVMPLAYQRFGTRSRGTASQRQEAAVATALSGGGFTTTSVTDIGALDDLPRGTFTTETRVAGAKCDVPLRLHDGRMLAIECKASNGPKNGWKRLLRETGGKAEAWRTAYGTQVVTAAVLSGVFDLSTLENAQTVGVTIFWEHDLQHLVDFATSAV